MGEVEPKWSKHFRSAVYPIHLIHWIHQVYPGSGFEIVLIKSLSGGKFWKKYIRKIVSSISTEPS